MIKKIFSSFVLTALSSGIFFIFNFVIAKIVGASIYGEIAYYLSFINLLALLISINYASLYMGSKITNNEQNTFSLFITIEVILFLLISLPAFFILKSFYIDSSYTIALILIISFLIVIVKSIALEYNSKKEVSLSIFYGALLPRLLLVTLFSLAIFFNLKEAIYYLYVFLFSYSLVSIYNIFKFKPKFFIKKDIFTRAWKFYLIGIIGSSFTYIAQILQKQYGGYEQLASLSIVLLFFAGFSLIGGVLVKFLLPKIHEFYREKDFKSIGKLYNLYVKIELLIVLPILIFLLFNRDYIAQFLGDGYRMFPIFFLILIVGFLVDLITGITGNILRATENEKYEIFNESVRLVVGLSLIYFFKDNIYGIAIAISASMVIYNLLKYIEVFYLFKFTPLNLKESLFYILLTIGLMGINYLFRYNFTIQNSLILGILFLIVVYLIIFLALRKRKFLLESL